MGGGGVMLKGKHELVLINPSWLCWCSVGSEGMNLGVPLKETTRDGPYGAPASHSPEAMVCSVLCSFVNSQECTSVPLTNLLHSRVVGGCFGSRMKRNGMVSHSPTCNPYIIQYIYIYLEHPWVHNFSRYLKRQVFQSFSGKRIFSCQNCLSDPSLL